MNCSLKICKWEYFQQSVQGFEEFISTMTRENNYTEAAVSIFYILHTYKDTFYGQIVD